jgi:HK97 family phage major capsid protein
VKIATQIKEQLASKQEEAKSLWAGFATDRDAFSKKGLQPGTDEYKTAFSELHEKHAEYAKAAEQVESLQGQLMEALEMDGDGPPATESKGFGEGGEQKGAAEKIWTPGQRLIESKAYKDLLESGELSKKSVGDFKASLGEVATREEFKTLITGLSRTSGGAFIVPDRQPGLVSLLIRPLVVRQLVTVGDTDVDIVEWVKENSFTNAAAETAEATATSGASGTKPESGIDYAVVQSTVKNIAHWIPATKRALADAGQLRTLIDQRLQDGINLRLDSQMINGDATGENLRGILNTSGVLTQARGVDPGLEAVLKGMTQLRLGFVEPTAVLMHPTDVQNLRLAKNAQGNYYFGNPNQGDAFTLWGLPIAQSAAVPVGTAIVAKWDEAMLWVREGVTVTATDSHQRLLRPEHGRDARRGPLRLRSPSAVRVLHGDGAVRGKRSRKPRKARGGLTWHQSR